VRPISEHGYAVTLTGGPITTDVHLRTRTWHRDWLATSVDGQPALIAPGGTTPDPAVLTALTASLEPRPGHGSN
jgi:hypothetical protein